MKTVSPSLSNKIRMTRLERRLTLNELSEKLNISPRTIRKVESGCEIKIQARIYDTFVDWLLEQS